MNFPRQAVDQAFTILPPKMDTLLARIPHAAIGYQESKYKSRRQIISKGGVLVPEGPAASYWQFENGKLAGINGVLTHHATKQYALDVCRRRGVTPERMAVWEAMQSDDVLGAAFARLLMYSNPVKLPDTMQNAWWFYLYTWRPGKPHPQDWAESWAFAVGEYA